jgi:hypothetical protein
VFFCTPQILSNDLKTGVCPAEEVVCLVLDECHKAVGDSDYVKAARALFDRRVKFRLLALSATPGSSFNKIQVRGPCSACAASCRCTLAGDACWQGVGHNLQLDSNASMSSWYF